MKINADNKIITKSQNKISEKLTTKLKGAKELVDYYTRLNKYTLDELMVEDDELIILKKTLLERGFSFEVLKELLDNERNPHYGCCEYILSEQKTNKIKISRYDSYTVYTNQGTGDDQNNFLKDIQELDSPF